MTRNQAAKFCCYLCGSDSSTVLSKRSEFDASNPCHLCNSCGLAQQYPMPSQVQLQDLYNGQYYKKKKVPIPRDLSAPSLKAPLKTATCQAKYLASIITGLSSLSVLDFGAGRGLLGHTLSTIGACKRVICVEADPDMSHFIREKLRLLCYSDVESFVQFERNTQVDLMVMSHVFEHLPDPIGFLNGSTRTLIKPGGLLWIEVPNIMQPRVPIGLPWWVWFKIGHTFHYSPISLGNILEKADFHPIRVDTTEPYAIRVLCSPTPSQKVVPLAQSRITESEHTHHIIEVWQRHRRRWLLLNILLFWKPLIKMLLGEKLHLYWFPFVKRWRTECRG